MSKEMCGQELTDHCRESIEALNESISKLSVSEQPKMRKRAMLIAYWIKTYVKYILSEDTFSSQSVFRLKRGNIIQVEFGYRVGRELGGLHYAVVLDSDNSIFRNTVTVIPLGSTKGKPLDEKYSITLEEGIYGPVFNKLDALIKEGQAMVDEAARMQTQIDAAGPESTVLRTVQRTKMESARAIVENARNWASEINHMRQGSFALVDQITTISKMRIVNPLQKTHPLYGIKLTPKDMDKIDVNLKSLFFPEIE